MSADSINDVVMCNVDAAKRRQLPAWIREGLEKMERDKQRQLEKDRQKLQQDVDRYKDTENETSDEKTADRDSVTVAAKSRFVCASVLFYTFNFAVILWCQKNTSADVTAVFVNTTLSYFNKTVISSLTD